MRLKGKIAVWFWVLGLGAGIDLLYELFFDRDGVPEIVFALIVWSVVFLPIFIRNYVEIQGSTLTVCFGFSKETVPIGEITEVYRTHNPIASSAASLDRIVVKTKKTKLMCSVRNKEKLFEELKKRNPEIKVR